MNSIEEPICIENGVDDDWKTAGDSHAVVYTPIERTKIAGQLREAYSHLFSHGSNSDETQQNDCAENYWMSMKKKIEKINERWTKTHTLTYP